MRDLMQWDHAVAEQTMAMLQRCQRRIIGIINMVANLFPQDLAKRGQISAIGHVQVRLKASTTSPTLPRSTASTISIAASELRTPGILRNRSAQKADRISAFFRHCRHLAQTLH